MNRRGGSRSMRAAGRGRAGVRAPAITSTPIPVAVDAAGMMERCLWREFTLVGISGTPSDHLAFAALVPRNHRTTRAYCIGTLDLRGRTSLPEAAAIIAASQCYV